MTDQQPMIPLDFVHVFDATLYAEWLGKKPVLVPASPDQVYDNVIDLFPNAKRGSTMRDLLAPPVFEAPTEPENVWASGPRQPKATARTMPSKPTKNMYVWSKGERTRGGALIIYFNPDHVRHDCQLGKLTVVPWEGLGGAEEAEPHSSVQRRVA